MHLENGSGARTHIRMIHAMHSVFRAANVLINLLLLLSLSFLPLRTVSLCPCASDDDDDDRIVEDPRSNSTAGNISNRIKIYKIHQIQYLLQIFCSLCSSVLL